MIFRILLVAGGLLLLFIIGKPVMNTFINKIAGQSVEGVVIGFRGKGSSKAILESGDGKYKHKKKARRPVVKYTKVPGSLDSLVLFSKSTALFAFLNFEKGDVVEVVFSKNNKGDASIWSLRTMFTDLILVGFCFFMIWLGFKKSF